MMLPGDVQKHDNSNAEMKAEGGRFHYQGVVPALI